MTIARVIAWVAIGCSLAACQTSRPLLGPAPAATGEQRVAGPASGSASSDVRADGSRENVSSAARGDTAAVGEQVTSAAPSEMENRVFKTVMISLLVLALAFITYKALVGGGSGY